MAQTATTGSLENAQKIIIATSRYTEEHNAPAMNLIEQFNLPSGNKQVTVPKVGQMTMSDLVDGLDIVDEESIGMTTVDLTASEVGAKIVITDKLSRQSAENVFSIIGRQLGDGMARKKDVDVLALYSGFGTDIGATGRSMSLANVSATVAYAKGKKFGSQVYIVQHPFAVWDIANTAVTASSTYPVPAGWSQDLLGNFFSGLRPINGVPIFEDGNITIDSSDDAIGVCADKTALAVLKSVDTRTERQRDASLRATEVVITADYGVFELDDSKGVALTLDAGTPATS
ncbi:hypothetical protein CMI37_32605 [Candidatus Pacearchaeota archaeon]|nr:hypothetical protein [Candidatus Pacearchaeota archaeon]